MMKRLLYLYILFTLLFSPGCAGNIRNIPTDISSTDSIIVGRIETVPVLWEFSLYEEKSETEDLIDIAGNWFGLSRGSKLQNQGYIFKIARPGTYLLRLEKRIKGKSDYDHILRFELPKGKLVYFGTIRVVIDHVESPFQGNKMLKETPIAFRYHYVHIDEVKTLKHFEEQYPKAFSSYKDNIIWIPSSSQPAYITSIPTGNYLYDKLALWFSK